ncbi:MAG TPA: DUF998 domain-containing protein [Erysipelotrichaceae bacterium]|nr:DUF998 domain-containing protein [Erysipelotrichaceae bacterium]
MNRKLINWLGLTGIVAFVSYTLAVVISPSAFPGYNWMEQAVSDLSAENAPSRMLWNQIAALYGVCSVVCVTCVSLYVSENKVSTRLFRMGMHLFSIMNWISYVGYAMFPLADSGKEIASFQEIMHMAVTAAVVILSIVSLVCLIIAGFRKEGIRGIGIWAAVAFIMMMIGAIGKGVVPPRYFGIVERCSVFAAVGFNAVCGMYLFRGFPDKPDRCQTV